MNYKHNKRYFSATTLSKLAVVCWVLTGAGFAVLFFQVWELYIIGGSIGVIACICGFVFSTYSMRDKEYDELCAEYSEPFRQSFIDFINEKLNAHSAHNKSVVSVDAEKMRFFEGPFFESDSSVKKGNDGLFRSSEYYLTACVVEKNTFYLGRELHSLVSQRDEHTVEAFPVTDIESIMSYTPDGLSPFARYIYLRLTLKNGTRIDFPVQNDAALDNVVSDVTDAVRRIEGGNA